MVAISASRLIWPFPTTLMVLIGQLESFLKLLERHENTMQLKTIPKRSVFVVIMFAENKKEEKFINKNQRIFDVNMVVCEELSKKMVAWKLREYLRLSYLFFRMKQRTLMGYISYTHAWTLMPTSPSINQKDLKLFDSSTQIKRIKICNKGKNI